MTLCSLGRSCFAKLYNKKKTALSACASSRSLSIFLSLSLFSLSLSQLSKLGERVTYGIVGSAVGKLLADELVHPGFLLVVVVGGVGAHEARDDERHRGLA